MLLHSKLQEVGAHKGMIFSTSGFQSGAIEFAQAHGIATLLVADEMTKYLTKATVPLPRPPKPQGYVGWFLTPGEEGLRQELVDCGFLEPLRTWLAERW
jgi:restriction system protein